MNVSSENQNAEINCFGSGIKTMPAYRVPDFYIVGAPKCGTTALFSYLAAHPSVFMPEKEPHHFCSDLTVPSRFKSFGDYCDLYRDAPNGKMLGEGSVWYLYSKTAIKNILARNPDAKFIAILRNPVEALQAYHATCRLGLVENIEDLEEAWRAQDDRRVGKRRPLKYLPQAVQYADVYSYSHQVRRLIENVPETQRIILIYEDFFAASAKHYARLLQFLGLPHDGRMDFPVVGGAMVITRPWVQKMLSRPSVPLSLVWGALSHLHPDYKRRIWKTAMKLTKPRPGTRKKLRPGFERELYDFFEGDIQALESLLGRSLNGWRWDGLAADRIMGGKSDARHMSGHRVLDSL